MRALELQNDTKRCYVDILKHFNGAQSEYESDHKSQTLDTMQQKVTSQTLQEVELSEVDV